MSFIVGAKVEIYRANVLIAWGYTDEEGKWSTILSPGVYKVIISKPGYQTVEEILEILRETEFKVRLPEVVVPVPIVREFIELPEVYFIRFSLLPVSLQPEYSYVTLYIIPKLVSPEFLYRTLVEVPKPVSPEYLYRTLAEVPKPISAEFLYRKEAKKPISISPTLIPTTQVVIIYIAYWIGGRPVSTDVKAYWIGGRVYSVM